MSFKETKSKFVVSPVIDAQANSSANPIGNSASPEAEQGWLGLSLTVPPWWGGVPQSRTTPCPSLTDTGLLGLVSKFSRSWGRRRKQSLVIVHQIYSQLHPKLSNLFTQEQSHILDSRISFHWEIVWKNLSSSLTAWNYRIIKAGKDVPDHPVQPLPSPLVFTKYLFLQQFYCNSGNLCLQLLLPKPVYYSVTFSSTIFWNLQDLIYMSRKKNAFGSVSFSTEIKNSCVLYIKAIIKDQQDSHRV